MAGRRVSLPIDILPRAALAERLAVSFILMMILLLAICAVGLALVLGVALALHVYRSYDLGASLRALIDRGMALVRRDRAPRSAAAPEGAHRRIT